MEIGTVYIAIILCCRVVQHLYGKKSSVAVEGRVELIRYSGFRMCVSAVFALGLVLLGKGGFKANATAVGLSVLSGTALAISVSCSLIAMKTGMVSLVSLFGTAGMIIPCLAGVFFFDTPIAPMQWLGFAMFMVAAYLMIVGSRKTVSGFSMKTLILLVIVMLAEGVNMLAQQMFTQYVENGNIAVFSLLSFGIPGVFMLVLAFADGKKQKTKTESMSAKLAVYGVVLAAAVLVINQLATAATAFVPPVILFTFINGGSTVIAAIVASVVYKERLTYSATIGIVLGILSFVMMKKFEV